MRRSDSREVESLLAAILAGDDASPCLVPDRSWETLLRATPMDLRPYLAWRLRERRLWGAAPTVVRRSLEVAARAAAGRYLLQRHALRDVLAALGGRGIPALVLKGAVLAHTAYPDPALRPMVDLDLLVPSEHWGDARAALVAIGYRVPARWAVRPETGPAAKDERDKPLMLPGTIVAVELHAGLDGFRAPFRLDVGSVWPRAVEVSLDGLQARTLHPEDLLLHVALHLAVSDLFRGGLRPLVDLTLLLGRNAWDWQVLSRRWTEQGLGAWMALVLGLAHELLAAPAVALAALPRVPSEARCLALEQIWRAPFVGTPPGIVTVLGARSGARLALALRRLNPWRAEEGAVGLIPASLAAVRRLAVDLGSRLPRYARALRRGDLSAGRLDEAVALLRAREELARLMSPLEVPPG